MENNVKWLALDYAVKSGAGNDFTENGERFINADRILEAAKKFENYLNQKETKNV